MCTEQQHREHHGALGPQHGAHAGPLQLCCLPHNRVQLLEGCCRLLGAVAIYEAATAGWLTRCVMPRGGCCRPRVLPATDGADRGAKRPRAFHPTAVLRQPARPSWLVS
jgi:hypothetical protein